ncbi:unnamed protein product [Parnassius apollo]|uniref:(apollo) hypothetical protein n=1 Tax=Parnassius apollo TaxID=110799 RepID=A0A8S3WZG4_PARAO|nr:unnamed protein product [Parnassius apollo]
MATHGDYISVVFDLGSQNTKAGFAGESFPRCMIPTTLGRLRRRGLSDGFPDVTFGDEAIKMRGVSHLNWPVDEGFIKDWDEVEKLWHHIFYRKLHVPPEEARVMYVTHPLASKRYKEKITEIMFECFMVRNIYLGPSPALVLHASGRTSGIVWENGYSCSYIAPVFEGFPLKNATITSQINGKTLTDCLQKLMIKVGYCFTTPMEKELLESIKVQLCYVAREYGEEVVSYSASEKNKIKFDLPDGQHVLIGEERFKCPELLFQPHLLKLQCPSIVDDICTSIKKCDLEYKPLFYNNIVLSGGSTLFKGLSDRLALELNKQVKDLPGVETNVDAMSSRHLAAWAGGSILASMDSLNGFWMTKEEYEDDGADRIHCKFF